MELDKSEKLKKRRKYRKGEKHLIADIIGFNRISQADVKRKYTDINNTHIELICTCYVIENDNGGYFTKQDLERYTGLHIIVITGYMRKLGEKGYLLPINEKNTRYARRYKLEMKGHNLIRYLNRTLLTLLEHRSFYASVPGRADGVLFSGAGVGEVYAAKKRERKRKWRESQKD